MTMKELKHIPIINQHYPIRQRREVKFWVRAQARPEKYIVMQNNNTEAAYHRVIVLVKSLMQPGEVYYERNLKGDYSQGLLGMHSFVSPCFSWSLYCQLTYNYFIEFAFGDCPFKIEIMNELKAYPCDRVASEMQLNCDYTTFYRTVLEIQDAAFIFTL